MLGSCARALGLSVVLAIVVGARAEAAPVQAGVAAAVRGSVLRADAPGAVGQVVQSGAPIYMGDEIRTGPDAGLQILLLDETVFTIGPSSRLTIDRFVFDPVDGSGEVTARVAVGVFRFVSGRIARRDPDKMTVRLPPATIGIRGTSAAGVTDGVSASVVLLGPGAANSANERAGRVRVGNAAGSVDLREPQFGTTVAGAGAPPSVPELWSPERLDAIGAALASSPAASESQSSDAESGADASGDADAEDATAEETTESGAEVADAADADVSASELAGQTEVESLETVDLAPLDLGEDLSGAELPTDAGVPLLSELTTFDQLRSLTFGSALFSQASVPLAGDGGSGFYNLDVGIDFGQQSVELKRFDGMYLFGSTTSGNPVSFQDPGVGTTQAFFFYGAQTGFANNFSDASGGNDFMQLMNGDTVRLDVEILNDGSEIAARLHSAVTVTEAQTGQTLTGGETSSRVGP